MSDKPEERGAAVAQQPQSESRAVASIRKPRLPYDERFKLHFNIGIGEFKVLCESLFPLAKSSDAIYLALAYCRAKKYDIMKKPVHIVPMWNSELNREVETVWTSITEHRIIAHRTGEYAGCDATTFGEMKTEHFEAKVERGKLKGRVIMADVTFPEWAQVTVYRQKAGGAKIAYPGPRTYFREFFGQSYGIDVPNSRWARAPSQMLEKCAEAAALRKAFTEVLGSDPTAEEMEGRQFRQASTGTDEPRPQASASGKGGKSETEIVVEREEEEVVASNEEPGEDTVIEGEFEEEPDTEQREAETDTRQNSDAATPEKDETAEFVQARIAELPKRDAAVLAQMDESVRAIITKEGRDADLLPKWIEARDARAAELKKAEKPKTAEAQKEPEKAKASTAKPIDPREEEYQGEIKRLEGLLAKTTLARTLDDLEDEAARFMRPDDKAAFIEKCNAKARELSKKKG